MVKYYYENVLASQNITAKPNLVWVADITTLRILDRRFYVFLCNDVHTNKVVAHLIRSTSIDSKAIVNVLAKAIDKRFVVAPKSKLIINTDRGTQFSSQAYNNFTERSQDYFLPSMSRENTPTDNAVAERFMKTFKEHKIDGITIEDLLTQCILENPNFRNSRSILNQYVRSLNEKPNRKSLTLSPEKYDKQSSMAAMLMAEPAYPKAFSKHFGDDFRFDEISKFKMENLEVASILNEIALKKAELVEKTPFDDFENNIALKVIDQRLSEIHSLIADNHIITKEYVEEAIQPIEESLEELHYKIDKLLPKNKKERETQLLRDPVNSNLFPVFMGNSGNSYTYQKDLKRAQLRISYTVLYYVGLRINEIRQLTEKKLLDAIAASQFSIIHHKTNQPYIHVLSKTGVKALKNLKTEFTIVFRKYKYKFLFGEEKPIHEKTLIQVMNRDLKHTCEVCNLPYNIKSHSFRVNVISNLLKITTVQNTADIIGHRDIRSTMAYRRYALSKEEINDLLEKITNNETEN
jgi:transposase InsO family protein/integrase